MMTTYLEQYIEIISNEENYDEEEELNESAAKRLDELCARLTCKCCEAKGGTGFGPFPRCSCDHYEQCAGCEKCLEHCSCFTRGEILARLREQQRQANEMIKQANALAVSLGLDELAEGWDINQLADLEKRLRVQSRAVGRLLRRFREWEKITGDLGNLGNPETQARNKEVEFLNPPYVEIDGGFQ